MRCPACRNPCLDTDVRCPHCQHCLVSTEPETQLSPPAVCGLIFAAVGAGAIAIAPIPEGIQLNQFVLMGIGAAVGGAVGAVIGWFIDRHKKQAAAAKSGEYPSSHADGSRVGN